MLLQWTGYSSAPTHTYYHKAPGGSMSSPALADLDGTGPPEVVVAAGLPEGGGVPIQNELVADVTAEARTYYAFRDASPQPQSAWAYAIPGAGARPAVAQSIPTVLEPDPRVEGDPRTLIVSYLAPRATEDEGWTETNLLKLGAAGNPIGVAQPHAGVPLAMPVVLRSAVPHRTLLVYVPGFDDNTPDHEIRSQDIVAVNATNLAQEHKRIRARDRHEGFPVVADIDGDGRPNLLVLENGTWRKNPGWAHADAWPSNLTVYDHELNELWRVPIDDDVPVSLAVADIDGDDRGRCEIVVAAGATASALFPWNLNHRVLKAYEPCQPDLAPTRIWLDEEPILNRPASVKFKVRNAASGCPASLAGVNTFVATLTSDAGDPAVTQTIDLGGPLNPGVPDKTAELEWTPTVAQDADRRLTLTLDPVTPDLPDGSIVELSEANNTILSDPLFVHGEDLTITNAVTTPNQGTEHVAGKPSTVTATLRNIGQTKVQNAFDVEFTDGNSNPMANVAAGMPFAPQPGSQQTVTIPWTPTQPGHFAWRVTADPSRVVTETNEGNNVWPTASPVFVDVRAPNLTIRSADVLVQQSGSTAGSTVSVSATVRNWGDFDATNVAIAFLFDGATSTACPTATLPMVAKAGGSASVSCTWTRPDSAAHTVRVLADPSDTVREWDETDNGPLLDITSTLPELQVRDVVLSPASPTVQTSAVVTVTVENVGPMAAGPFTVRLAHAGDLDASQPVTTGLPPGASAELAFPWTPKAGGERTLQATVDENNQVTEADEQNNVFAKQVRVLAPDLRFDPAVLATASSCDDPARPLVCIETATSLSVRVVNGGEAPLEGSVTVLFKENAQVLGYRSATIPGRLGPGKPGLLPGDAVFVTLANWEPLNPGFRWVNATIDANATIPESNEQNNALSSKILVRAPDFLVIPGDLRVEPPPRVGQPSKVSLYVRNRGPVAGAPLVQLSVKNLENRAPIVVLPQQMTMLTFGHNDVTDLEWSWTPPVDGRFEFTATVDPDAKFKEYREDDNVLQTIVYVHGFDHDDAGQLPVGWRSSTDLVQNPLVPFDNLQWEVAEDAPGNQVLRSRGGLPSRVWREVAYTDYTMVARMKVQRPLDLAPGQVPLPDVLSPTPVPTMCVGSPVDESSVCTPEATTPPVGGNQSVPEPLPRGTASLLFSRADAGRSMRLEFDLLKGRIALVGPGCCQQTEEGLPIESGAYYDVRVEVRGRHVAAFVRGPGISDLKLEGDHTGSLFGAPARVGFDVYPSGAAGVGEVLHVDEVAIVPNLQPFDLGFQNNVPTPLMSWSIQPGRRVLADASASEDLDGDALSYEWTFGDGSSSTNAKPSHAYPNAGEYTLSLRVKDSRGGTAQASQAAVPAACGFPLATLEGFEATTMDGECWYHFDYGGSGQSETEWRILDKTVNANCYAHAGHRMLALSVCRADWYNGHGNYENDYVMSPFYDLSGLSAAKVRFHLSLDYYGGNCNSRYLALDVRVAPSGAWTERAKWCDDSSGPQTIDVGTAAAGKSLVQFRFRFLNYGSLPGRGVFIDEVNVAP